MAPGFHLRPAGVRCVLRVIARFSSEHENGVLHGGSRFLSFCRSPPGGFSAGVDLLAGDHRPRADPPTFVKDVAPILWKNCASCHRPGEIGPFSLLNYEDAQKRADFLAEVTKDRRMPPWKAEPGFGKFQDERRLSADEIDVLANWAAAGAPEGDPKQLPKPPTFPDGWQLGEPDLVLKMEQPFEIPADGPDVYRCFVIPIPIDKDAMVSAVEFRPGNHSVVHHAILFLDANGKARQKGWPGRQARL